VTAEVVLDRLTKRFEGAAVSGLSLSVERGEFLVLVGPSGCGKSTTLRLVAGLEEPDDGTIAICGKPMANVAPQDRDVAMVFQNYALYPQMTVREILEFPLRMRGASREERARAVGDATDLLRLGALLGRRPGELSGGERQRVAMGRAIVRRPRVFLFDEPLSNLDVALRSDLRVEIGALVRRLGATAIYVTHDQVEAMTLADRICVMRGGELQQLATAREIYEKPGNAFVATFIGSPRMNIIPAQVENGTIVAGPFRIPAPKELPPKVELGVRSEDVKVGAEGGARAEIEAVEPLGAETHIVARLGDLRMSVRCPGFAPHRRGDSLELALDPARVHLFDPMNDGARLHADIACSTPSHGSGRIA
jgi:multiple sugar transport system ATP-binding protein